MFDLTMEILDRDGKPFRLAADGPALTLKTVLRMAIDTPVEGDNRLTLDKKVKLYNLGDRLRADEAELTADEIILIVERVSGFWASVLITGRVLEVLDPARLRSGP